MGDTIAETVELLYTIDPDQLTVDQQIALAHAYAALAQAERLGMLHERLTSIHQILNNWVVKAAVEGVR